MLPVAHVEAGLRSGDIHHPWPEEINRRIIGTIAALHCAPTDTAADALRRELFEEGNIELLADPDLAGESKCPSTDTVTFGGATLGETHDGFDAESYLEVPVRLFRELIRRACLDLRDKRHRSLSLWVLKKNQRALPFYKALGGQRCGKKTIEIGNRSFEEVCFGWRDTAPLIEA